MTMKQLSPSLRKAAVLVSALDERQAEALLLQMGEENAAKVRSALVELHDVPLEEQQRVLAEFFHAQNGSPQSTSDDGGVDLELNPAVEAAAATFAAAPEPSNPPATVEPEPSFDFLADVDPKAIAAVLAREL